MKQRHDNMAGIDFTYDLSTAYCRAASPADRPLNARGVDWWASRVLAAAADRDHDPHRSVSLHQVMWRLLPTPGIAIR